MTQRGWILLGLILSLPMAASAATYTVNPAGTGDFPTIQAAISAATAGDVIQLTDGTYRGEGNRDISFEGKAITVRSISQIPVACMIDCEGSEAEPHRGFHFISFEGNDAVLEGVLITNGYAADGGGGICCQYYSSPTIRNCALIGNHAHGGGGMWLYNDCSPIVTSCTFSANSCTGDNGGGVLVGQFSHPEFTDCTFTDNTSAGFGGGMLLYQYSEPTLTNCLFSGNEAPGSGAGLYCGWGSDPELIGCTFYGNTSNLGGGGVRCYEQSDPTLINCTFYGNEGDYGGAVYCTDTSNPFLQNCLISYSPRGSGVYCGGGCYPVLECCDVYGNAGGDWVDCISDQLGQHGNIGAEPMLCDAPNGNLGLEEDSPCGPNANPGCGLIGAWPVGCGTAGVPAVTDTRLMLFASPNPMSSGTRLSYFLEGEAGPVSLTIFDAAGRLVRSLVTEAGQPGGTHAVEWDGTDLGGMRVQTGIYYGELRVGAGRTARQIIVLR